MQAAMILWLVWGVVLVAYIAVRLYVMGLSRDEDDQLVLQDSLAHVGAEQASIVSRLNKVEPIRRSLMWCVIGMTLIVIGYYVIDMVRQFQ
jgi:hypothetical protein